MFSYVLPNETAIFMNPFSNGKIQVEPRRKEKGREII